MVLMENWELKHSDVGGIAWSEKNMSNSIAKENVWGLILNELIMAFVVFRNEAHAIEVDYLATNIKFQRAGHMSCVFSYLKELSRAEVKPIWLEVSKNNIKASQFYEKLGFINEASRKNYYKNGQEALIYSYNS